MLPFFEVLHETKTKVVNKLSSAQCGLEISFKPFMAGPPETLNVPQGKAEGKTEVAGKQTHCFPWDQS